MVDLAQRVEVSLAGGVADVRLNRPHKLNALDPETFATLAEVGAALDRAPDLRAVVLSGKGKAFCAGLDTGSVAALRGGGPDLLERTHGLGNLYQEAALVWRRLPVPVIAALHGAVLGGGLQVALGADIRIVAPDARLSVMEIRWGLVPDMAGTWLLRGLVRDDTARDLVFTGRTVDGEEAVRIGLATRLSTEPREAALALAREIASRSPGAIRAGKRLLGRADASDLAEALLAESAAQAAILRGPDFVEAVRANIESRSPVFAGPTPPSSGESAA